MIKRMFNPSFILIALGLLILLFNFICYLLKWQYGDMTQILIAALMILFGMKGLSNYM